MQAVNLSKCRGAVRRFPRPSAPHLSLVAGLGVLLGLTGGAPGQSANPGQPPASGSPRQERDGIRQAAVSTLLDVNTIELTGASQQAEVVSRIRATVNGMPILDDEVREAAYPYLLAAMQLPEPQRSIQLKEVFQRELQRLIERELILKDAMDLLNRGKKTRYLEKLKESAGKEFDKQMASMKVRANVKTDEELKAALRGQGLSIEGVRRQVERSFMAAEYMRSRIFPAIERIGHQQIVEYYEQHPNEFEVPDGVKWLDIFIDVGKYPNRQAARALADQVVARARGGEDFAKLSAAYDNGDSSYRDGEGYGHRRGEVRPPEAEPILFQMKDGDVGPVIEQANGFHVIKLVKRDFAGRQPLDEKTQTSIRNKLQNEVWDREYKRILQQLKRNAKIEISTAP